MSQPEAQHTSLVGQAVLSAASCYARRGWSVLPVPHRSKNPGFRLLAENIHTAKNRIRALSDRDELTHIYNIRAFMGLAGREHERAARQELTYAILMIDVDHLKSINDTHGHAAGNRALKLRRIVDLIAIGQAEGDAPLRIDLDFRHAAQIGIRLIF